MNVLYPFNVYPVCREFILGFRQIPPPWKWTEAVVFNRRSSPEFFCNFIKKGIHRKCFPASLTKFSKQLLYWTMVELDVLISFLAQNVADTVIMHRKYELFITSSYTLKCMMQIQVGGHRKIDYLKFSE